MAKYCLLIPSQCSVADMGFIYIALKLWRCQISQGFGES